MNTKKTIGLILSLAFLLVVFSILALNENQSNTDSVPLPHSERTLIRVAVCPTYADILTRVDTETYEIIKTGSTAESSALMHDGQVDMIVSGRTPKPGEPYTDNITAGEGYSFLSAVGGVVYKDKLTEHTIYTDRKPEVLKKIFPIQKVEMVDDVYRYLDRGIVITSWENTNYTKAEIVHLLEKNGERVALSRRPAVYCASKCTEKAHALASLLKRNKNI